MRSTLAMALLGLFAAGCAASSGAPEANAPPYGFSIGLRDGGIERQVCPDVPFESPGDCTIHGLASVSFTAWDPEEDDVIVELMVARHGETAAAPTHGATAPSGVTAAIALPGLVPGTRYDVYARVYDVGSLQSPFSVTPLSFYQGPCPEGATCACVPAARACWLDLDCCSGSCLGVAPDRSECR